MKWLEPLMPVRFDANEWYTIVIFVICTGVIILLPKRFPKPLSYFIFLFNIGLTAVGDYVLAGQPYDFYDTLDRDHAEFLDFPLHFVIYPGTIYAALYVYDAYLQNRKLLFLILGIGTTAFLEWISVRFFQAFTYKSWNLALSVCVYTVVYVLNLAAFEKAKRTVQDDMGTADSY